MSQLDPEQEWARGTPLDKGEAGVTSAEPADATTNPAVIEAKVSELAALGDVEYGQHRHAAASELKCGLEFLDRAVKKQQGGAASDETPGKGSRILFPDIEPYPEPVDGAELLDGLVGALNRHVITPAGTAETVALWVLFTHTHDAHVISPLLAILAPEPECGKSTLLDTISWLVPKPLPSSGTSPAVVYRVVEEHHPTLLTDELDTLSKEVREAIRGIYNAGHTRRFANILRMVPAGDDYETRSFSTWAPKAFAQIGRPPVTMLLRSVIVEMTRKAASQEVLRLPPDGTEELEALLRKCAKWGADNMASLKGKVPALPKNIGNRVGDNWMPLLNIADLAGGRWPSRTREILALTSGHEDDVSIGVLALQDIAAIFDRNGASKLGSAFLCEELHKLEDRPWAEYGRKQLAITKVQLANVLKRYHIKPREVRPNPGGISRENVRGYDIDDFHTAFSAFLPSQGATVLQPNETGALSAFQGVTGAPVVAPRNPPEPTSTLTCSTVAPREGAGEETGHLHVVEPDDIEREAIMAFDGQPSDPSTK